MDSSSDSSFDVVVIGGGCSGLPAAVSLSKFSNLKVLVLDGGVSASDRQRDDAFDSASGVGGAGLFSDGKFSFYPSGHGLFRNVGRDVTSQLLSSYRECVELLSPFGVCAPDMAEEGWRADIEYGEDSWMLKKYPSFYIGLEGRHAMIETLLEKIRCPILLETSVTHCVVKGPEHIELTIKSRQSESVRTICARRVVLAGGRFGVCLSGLEQYRTVYRRLEYGVRVVLPHSNSFLTRFDDTDPKLIYHGHDGIEYRTFCVCRRGEVVATSAYGITALSGRADCSPTMHSNFGFNARVLNESLGAEMLDKVLHATTQPRFCFPLSDQKQLCTLLGKEGGEGLIRGLQQFFEEFTEIDVSQVNLEGPTLEGMGYYFALTAHLQIEGARGIYVTGDATGIFRGIVASMVSGYLVGKLIGEELSDTMLSE